MAEPESQGGRPPDNSYGVIALVLGVASLPLVFCFGIGLAAGAGAVVLGGLGIYRVNQGRATNRRQALAGLICGAVAMLAVLAFLVLPD